MKIPVYESKENISSGSAPQAAGYQGAGSFMSEGVSRLPDGLRQFAHGLDRLNAAVTGEVVRERQEALELDLLKDMQAYKAQASLFQDAYMAANKGAAARDAAARGAAFHAEKLGALREKYGENAQALRYIESHGGSLAQSGIDGMRDYGRKEGEAYKESVYQGELEQARMVLTDWNKSPEERAAVYEDLRRKTLGFYGGHGRDATAALARLEAFGKGADAELFQGRLAYLHEADPEEAVRLAKAGLTGEVSAGFESGGDPSAVGHDATGGTSYGKYQIASRVGSMERFLEHLDAQAPDLAERLRSAGPADTGGRDGAMPAEWKKIAAESPDRFAALQREFIEKTHYQPALQSLSPQARAMVEKHPAFAEAVFSAAVQHGPGKVKGFVENALARGGNDAEAVLDHFYAARKEDFPSSSQDVRTAVAKRLDRERAALRDMARAAALSPQQWESELHKAEGAARERRRLAEAARVETAYDDLRTALRAAGGMTPEERDVAAAGWIEAIEDTEVRQKVKTRFTADRGLDEMRRRAEDARLGREFEKTARGEGWSPGVCLDKIEQVSGLSGEGRERLRKKYSGELNRATPANRRATDALLSAVDTQEITGREQLDAYVLEHGLTEKQAAQAERYLESGGNKGALRYSTVSGVYKSLTKQALNDPDFYELVEQSLPPGKAPTEAEVRRVAAGLIMKGERKGGSLFGYGENMTYAAALKAGPDVAARWLPEVSPAEERAIRGELKQAGFRGAIDTNRVREEKRRRMGLPPLPDEGKKP